MRERERERERERAQDCDAALRQARDGGRVVQVQLACLDQHVLRARARARAWAAAARRGNWLAKPPWGGHRAGPVNMPAAFPHLRARDGEPLRHGPAVFIEGVLDDLTQPHGPLGNELLRPLAGMPEAGGAAPKDGGDRGGRVRECAGDVAMPFGLGGWWRGGASTRLRFCRCRTGRGMGGTISIAHSWRTRPRRGTQTLTPPWPKSRPHRQGWGLLVVGG